MAQAVYVRQGMIFKAFLGVTGNPNDTVTVSGPELYDTYLLNTEGKAVITVGKKGEYTVTGTESTLSKSVVVEDRKVVYDVDVRFYTPITVIGNPGDSVSVTGPGGYSETIDIPIDGRSDVIAKKPGNYRAVGNISAVDVTITANDPKTAYTIDVSFTTTVNVQSNANSVVTLTSSSSSSIQYSGTTDANGVVAIVVYRYGTYSITSNVDTSAVLSTSPASSATVTCVSNGGSVSVNYVRVGDIPSISATICAANRCSISWSNPALYFSGVLIRYATGSPPGIDGGTLLGTSASTSISTGTLTNGTTYYFSGWSYFSINGKTFYATQRTTSWTAYAVSGVATFSSNGSWTVPVGVSSVTLFAVGGGGSGGASGSYTLGGAGGGGGRCARTTISVSPGGVVSWSIGAGGAAVTSGKSGDAANGNNGGTTNVYYNNGYVLGASGGDRAAAGGGSKMNTGGSGGSGGGGGAGYDGVDAGNGGSNGGNGGSGNSSGGSGQGASTVLFNGTYYAGGGGGGGVTHGGIGSPGSGGNWGGGAGGKDFGSGSYSGSTGGSGTDGAGGGGGGAGGTYNTGIQTTSGRGGNGAVGIAYS